MPKKKSDETEGVPVRVQEPSSRFADGVPVNVPKSAPQPSGSGSKSGQKATTTPKEQ